MYWKFIIAAMEFIPHIFTNTSKLEPGNWDKSIQPYTSGEIKFRAYRPSHIQNRNHDAWVSEILNVLGKSQESKTPLAAIKSFYKLCCVCLEYQDTCSHMYIQS